MKFKLFERLRDDNDTGSSPSNNSNTSPGLGGQSMDQDTGLGEGSLERTVEQMFDQGYSEDEIKTELQGQYSESEISRAVNQTVTQNATGKDNGPQPMTPYQSDDEPVSPMDEGYGQDEMEEIGQDQNNQQIPQQDQGLEQQGMDPQPQKQQMQQPIQQEGTQSRTVDPGTEELIETIIAENFERVKAEFENVYQELDTIEEAVEDLENRVHDLEVRDDEDQEQFVQKVEEMEDHIDSYQSRIGGLEKAFQQVLPNLVDNVRDLTSLVQEMKQENGIKTETQVSANEMKDVDDQLEDW